MSSLLEVQDARKVFGSLTAVDDVTFEIDGLECRSLIGPNGAGKTTLFNCICGLYDLDGGHIRFKGEDATDWTPDRMARNGLARSYQITNLFDEFTAFENVRLAAQIHTEKNHRLWTRYTDLEGPKEIAADVLDRVGLADERETLVSALSHGQKRQLELGVVLATDPDIVLLDEPTSGLSTENIGQMTDLIDDVREEYPILLIEHNIDIVMDMSDTIMVLDHGSLIAEGSPEEIADDERVQEAYLGTDQELGEEEIER